MIPNCDSSKKQLTDTPPASGTILKKKRNRIKMAKKSKSGQQQQLTEYEKQRMQLIHENTAKLEAAGLKSLVNLNFQQRGKEVARCAIDELCTAEEDQDINMDCQIQLDPLMANFQKVDNQVKDPRRTSLNEPKSVALNMDSSKGKKQKQQLTQTTNMADFMRMKCQQRHQKNKKNEQHPTSPLIQQPMSRQEHLLPQIQPHNLTQQEYGQRKKQQTHINKSQQNENNFCSPGSMSRYLQVRRLEKSKERQSNDLGDNSALMNGDFDLQQRRNVTNSESEFSEDEENNPTEVASTNDLVAGNAHAPDVLAGNANAHDVLAGNGNAATQEKRRRGRTILAEIHARTIDNRDPIILNTLHQLVAPKGIVRKLSNFLGTLAKDCTRIPLTFISWRYVPEELKNKLWEYVQTKFIIPDEGKKWVLQTINANWRLHKTRLKGEYYTKYKTWEERMANRPDIVPESEFIELLKFWDSDAAQEISTKNKENRQKQHDMHTMGPCSMAVLRHELQQNDPNKREPSQAEVYIESRKRKAGRTYLAENEKSLENIEKMKALKSVDDGSSKSDPYFDVITEKEHSGRLRLFGRGVTKSKLKDKDGKVPFILPSVLMESITQQLEQKVKEQVEKTVEARVEQVLSKIREANPGIDLVIPELPTIDGTSSDSHANLVDESIGHSNLP